MYFCDNLDFRWRVAFQITALLLWIFLIVNKQSSYTREELFACARGELFGSGNAQLPLPNMLMVDRIIYIGSEGGRFGKGEIVAELDIHPDLWFFGCHFIGDPVMPGCLGLDAMWHPLEME